MWEQSRKSGRCVHSLTQEEGKVGNAPIPEKVGPGIPPSSYRGTRHLLWLEWVCGGGRRPGGTVPSGTDMADTHCRLRIRVVFATVACTTLRHSFRKSQRSEAITRGSAMTKLSLVYEKVVNEAISVILE